MTEQDDKTAPRPTVGETALIAEVAKDLGEKVDGLSERVDRQTVSLRRSKVWNVTVSGALLLSLLALLQSHTTSNAQDAAAMDRRIIAAGQRFAGCTDDNVQTEALGRTFDNLFIASASANPNRPLDGLSRTLDVLRRELRVSECEAYLAGLTPEEAERARAIAAGIPRRPLPPPSIPGYVPPPSGAD